MCSNYQRDQNNGFIRYGWLMIWNDHETQYILSGNVLVWDNKDTYSNSNWKRNCGWVKWLCDCSAVLVPMGSRVLVWDCGSTNSKFNREKIVSERVMAGWWSEVTNSLQYIPNDHMCSNMLAWDGEVTYSKNSIELFGIIHQSCLIACSKITGDAIRKSLWSMKIFILVRLMAISEFTTS